MKSATLVPRAARIGAATLGGILLSSRLPLLGAALALIAAIFLGVVLPAVWSAKPDRRAAALATLKEILAIIRPGGAHPSGQKGND